MVKPKILVCDHSPEFFLESIAERGFEIEYHPEISNDELHRRSGGFEALLIKSSLIISESFMSRNPELEWVFRPGSGLDNVDLSFAKRRGVYVVNTPEGNCNAVAEHAMGMLLSMLNHMPKALKEVQNGKWIREPNRGIELENRSVAVIGVGHTGTAFCQKLAGFNVNLLPYDKYKPFINTIDKPSVRLEEVFEESEVVSLHLPLTRETREYANDSFFDQFKKPIYLINTSRGKVVSEEALLKAIDSGKVLGACLDVLMHEPLSKYTESEHETLQKLLATDKVFITPHIAGWTHEAKHKMFAYLLNKYDNLIEKKQA